MTADERKAYNSILANLLNANKQYPRRAQLRRVEGTVVVQFALSPSGAVLSRDIAKSSGATMLDEAALNMVDRSSPLPAPPKGYGPAPHRFVIPVDFQLQ